MRRFFLWLLIALLLGGLLSLALTYDTGYIRISLGHYLIETNFWVGLGLLLVLVLVIQFILSIARRVEHGSGLFGEWLTQSGKRRARRRTTQGLLALAEGNWPRARKLLETSAENANTPLINYLAAAQAAHEEGDIDAAEELLRRAFESTPGSDLAVGLTQAQLQLDAGRLEQSLATLLRLRKQSPHHPFILKLLKTVYTRLEDWRELSQLLPELRKQHVLGEEELRNLEQETWLKLLQRAAEDIRRQGGSPNLEPLNQLWDELPSGSRKDEAVILAYAGHLSELGAEAQAETLLRKVLRNHWSDALIGLYGRIAGAKPDEQLLIAEQWLKARPNNAELLLALGRLSLRNELWGKAKEYFEASLRQKRQPETLAELSRLAAHMGENAASVKYLMQGLLKDSGIPDLPMPKA